MRQTVYIEIPMLFVYRESCKYQGNELKEGRDENNGICLYVDKDSDPDYKIKSIQPYSTHISVMLERNDDIGS